MTQNNPPKVSINVLGYNSKKYLKSCFESIFSQTYPNLEILYIDNNSVDGSVEEVKKLKNQNLELGGVKIIENKKNLGYAEGHNIGICESSGEYIFCLNPDIILDNNFVRSAVDFFIKHREAGAITGKILKFKIHAGNEVEKTNIIDSLGLAIFKSHRVVERGGEEEDRGQYDRNEKVFGVSGAAPVFRRKALEDVKCQMSNVKCQNYFDRDFFAYKEDVDLSFRLNHAGWQCWYVAQVLAFHDRWERGSGQNEKKGEILARRRKKSKLVNYLSYWNHLMMLFKNEFAANLIIYFLWIFWYEFRKFVYILFFETKNIRGFIDFITFLPLTFKKRRDILSRSKIKPKEIRSWLI
jgi:GT2 family glycosyltransferase